MNCVFPPELDDRQLLAYLDGETDSQVAHHLAQCPHCRENASRLAHLQDQLTARLYRISCPSSLELGDYQLGLLSTARAVVIAQHVNECPHCKREVSMLREYLNGEIEPTMQAGLAKRVNIMIARLVRGGQGWAQSPSVPGVVGIRGGDEGPRIYQVDGVQLALEIQDDAGSPGRKVVLGLVTGLDSTGLRATLRQADQIVATTSADNAGNFVFSQLNPGNYQLILTRPEVEIHVQSLEF
jgi:anti-sigma factor RsiW